MEGNLLIEGLKNMDVIGLSVERAGTYERVVS